MGRTTVLIILHGSNQPVLGASTRRPILVYQAANSEEELRRTHLPRTSVNKGKRKDRSLKIKPRPSQLSPLRASLRGTSGPTLRLVVGPPFGSIPAPCTRGLCETR